MHCHPILALLTIARLAEANWDATGVVWFLFANDLSRLIFITPVPGLSCKRVDGTEVTEDGHDAARPISRE